MIMKDIEIIETSIEIESTIKTTEVNNRIVQNVTGIKITITCSSSIKQIIAIVENVIEETQWIIKGRTSTMIDIKGN